MPLLALPSQGKLSMFRFLELQGMFVAPNEHDECYFPCDFPWREQTFNMFQRAVYTALACGSASWNIRMTLAQERLRLDHEDRHTVMVGSIYERMEPTELTAVLESLFNRDFRIVNVGYDRFDLFCFKDDTPDGD